MIRWSHAAAALAAGGILAFALAAPAYRRDMGQARRTLAESDVMPSPFGPIEWAERGDGEAILVSHGTGGGFDQGLAMAGALGKHFRLIAPSRFGYLRSGMPANASPALQAEAFAHLLDRRRQRRVHVMGISAGALSAFAFAIRYPERVRSLVLVAPAAYDPEWVAALPKQTPFRRMLSRLMLRFDSVFWATMKLSPGLVLRTLYGTDARHYARVPPVERRRLDLIMATLLPVSRRSEGAILDATVTSHLKPLALERIAAPTLIIAAEDDRFGITGPARSAAARIPDAELLMLEDGGHLLAGHFRKATEAIVAHLRKAARRDDATGGATQPGSGRDFDADRAPQRFA